MPTYLSLLVVVVDGALSLSSVDSGDPRVNNNSLQTPTSANVIE
jgi:hypothetical protein